MVFKRSVIIWCFSLFVIFQLKLLMDLYPIYYILKDEINNTRPVNTDVYILYVLYDIFTLGILYLAIDIIKY